METKEVTLPSGIIAKIRTYTTHRDDVEAEAILKGGMKVTMIDDAKHVELSPEAVLGSESKYVEMLTESIDGKTDNIPELLLGLRSKDYLALAEAVGEITKVSDPKGGSKS